MQQHNMLGNTLDGSPKPKKHTGNLVRIFVAHVICSAHISIKWDLTRFVITNSDHFITVTMAVFTISIL